MFKLCFLRSNANIIGSRTFSMSYKLECYLISSLLMIEKSDMSKFHLTQFSTDISGDKTDLQKLVSEVLRQACAVDRMVTSIPKNTVASRVKVVLDLGVCQRDVIKLFSIKPLLLQSTKFESLVGDLKSYGLKDNSIINFLNEVDNLDQVDSKRIEACFEWLRSVGMREEDIINTFQINPNIMNLSNKKVQSRMNSLKALFKSDDVIRIIATSPNILFENQEDITEKFMYVHQIMGVSQRQMLCASLFKYSLQHIRNRHIFLERAGLFVKEVKRNLGIPSINPTLDNIIDIPDAIFAAQFGKMSVKEYEAFCKLLAKEMSDNSHIEM